MPAGYDFDHQGQKQRAQYLNMRGAQMAQQQAGTNPNRNTQPKTSSKKQLVGTIIGIAVALAVLVLLAANGII